MNKFTWAIGGVILIAALVLAVLLLRNSTPAPQPESTTSTGNTPVGANGLSSIVTYTDAGFSPTPLTISVGTTVTWSNASTRSLAVADSSLNTDQCAQGGQTTALMQCSPVSEGGTYSFTFSKPGTYTYTNKEQRGDTGIIVVTGDGSAAGPLNPRAQPQ